MKGDCLWLGPDRYQDTITDMTFCSVKQDDISEGTGYSSAIDWSGGKGLLDVTIV